MHLRYFDAHAQRILLDKGDVKNISEPALKDSAQELLNYFYVGLRLPDSSFWVNLRPDSPQEIIDPDLEKTDIGRIMLEADVQLKKDLACYTNPNTAEGRQYWDKLYEKAEELFGQSDISIPTVTRPWIVPNEIILRDAGMNAYIYKATLKVMLESDYLPETEYASDDPRLKELNDYSSELIRRLILPKLSRQVNVAKRYAALRQVYYSLILAQWVKAKIRNQKSPGHQVTRSPVESDALLSGMDTRDVRTLASKKPWAKETYFKAYKKSFENGEYKLQENMQTPYGMTIRQYVSGGVEFKTILDFVTVKSQHTAGFLFDLKNTAVMAVTGQDPVSVETLPQRKNDAAVAKDPVRPRADFVSRQDGGSVMLSDPSKKSELRRIYAKIEEGLRQPKKPTNFFERMRNRLTTMATPAQIGAGSFARVHWLPEYPGLVFKVFKGNYALPEFGAETARMADIADALKFRKISIDGFELFDVYQLAPFVYAKLTDPFGEPVGIIVQRKADMPLQPSDLQRLNRELDPELVWQDRRITNGGYIEGRAVITDFSSLFLQKHLAQTKQDSGDPLNGSAVLPRDGGSGQQKAEMPDEVYYVVRQFDTFDDFEAWLRGVFFEVRMGAVLKKELQPVIETLAIIFGFESKPDSGLIESLGSIVKNMEVDPVDKDLVSELFYSSRNYAPVDSLPWEQDAMLETIQAELYRVMGVPADRHGAKLFSRIKQYKSLISKLQKIIFRENADAASLSSPQIMEMIKGLGEKIGGKDSELLDDMLGFNFIIDDTHMSPEQRKSELTAVLEELDTSLRQRLPGLEIETIRKESRVPGFEAGNIFIRGLLKHAVFGNLPVKIQVRFLKALFQESAMYYLYKTQGIWQIPVWAEKIEFDGIDDFKDYQRAVFSNFKKIFAGVNGRELSLRKRDLFQPESLNSFHALGFELEEKSKDGGIKKPAEPLLRQAGSLRAVKEFLEQLGDLEGVWIYFDVDDTLMYQAWNYPAQNFISMITAFREKALSAEGRAATEESVFDEIINRWKRMEDARLAAGLLKEVEGVNTLWEYAVNRGMKIGIITNRPEAMRAKTIEVLTSRGIDTDMAGRIIFAGFENGKGAQIVTALNGTKPKKIILVDNNQSHVLAFINQMSGNGIPVEAFWLTEEQDAQKGKDDTLSYYRNFAEELIGMPLSAAEPEKDLALLEVALVTVLLKIAELPRESQLQELERTRAFLGSEGFGYFLRVRGDSVQDFLARSYLDRYLDEFEKPFHNQRDGGKIAEEIQDYDPHKTAELIATFPTFKKYMETALYNPVWGYYGAGNVRFGWEEKDGRSIRLDFNTYPKMLSPAFGRLWADQIFTIYQSMRQAGILSSGEGFQIIEFGAGDGTLAKDILDYFQRRAAQEHGQWQEFFDRLQYIIGEHSPAMQERQKSTLSSMLSAHKAVIRSADARDPQGLLEEKPFKGVVISNELVDAFGIQRVRLGRSFLSEGRFEVCLSVPMLRFNQLEELKKIDADLSQQLFTASEQYRREMGLPAPPLDVYLSYKDFVMLEELSAKTQNKRLNDLIGAGLYFKELFIDPGQFIPATTLSADQLQDNQTGTSAEFAQEIQAIKDYLQRNKPVIDLKIKRNNGNAVIVNVNPGIRQYIRQIATILNEPGNAGYVMTVDYGGNPYSVVTGEGTEDRIITMFQGYNPDNPDDNPYKDPGRRDITGVANACELLTDELPLVWYAHQASLLPEDRNAIKELGEQYPAAFLNFIDEPGKTTIFFLMIQASANIPEESRFRFPFYGEKWGLRKGLPLLPEELLFLDQEKMAARESLNAELKALTMGHLRQEDFPETMRAHWQQYEDPQGVIFYLSQWAQDRQELTHRLFPRFTRDPEEAVEILEFLDSKGLLRKGISSWEGRDGGKPLDKDNDQGAPKPSEVHLQSGTDLSKAGAPTVTSRSKKGKRTDKAPAEKPILSMDVYLKSIERATEEGKIRMFSFQGAEDYHSPLNGIKETNTRDLSESGKQLLKAIMAATHDQPGALQTLVLGPGTGKECFDIRSFAETRGRDIEVDAVSLTALPPQLVVTKTPDELVEMIVDYLKANTGSVSQVKSYGYPLRNLTEEDVQARPKKDLVSILKKDIGLIPLQLAFDLQNKGYGVFSATGEEYIDLQYVGNFVGMQIDKTYDLVYDNHGAFAYLAVYYGIQLAVQKALSLLKPDGIFYAENLSLFGAEFKNVKLPEDFVALTTGDSDNLLIVRKESAHGRAIAGLLARSLKDGQVYRVFKSQALFERLMHTEAVLLPDDTRSSDPGAQAGGGRDGGQVAVIDLVKKFTVLDWQTMKKNSYRYSQSIPQSGIESFKFLPTDQILPETLGYSVGLRPASRLGKIPDSIADFKEVRVVFPDEEIFMVSKWHGGSAGIVMLGFLEGVVPVAVKTYRFEGKEYNGNLQKWLGKQDWLLQDFKGGTIADRLGIGPRIHGKYTDREGNVGMVMDIIPGDFMQAESESITLETFKDFITIRERLDRFNVSVGGDFQFHVTPSGRIQVIDQGALEVLPEGSNVNHDGYWYSLAVLLDMANARVEKAALAYIAGKHKEYLFSLDDYLKTNRPRYFLDVAAEVENTLREFGLVKDGGAPGEDTRDGGQIRNDFAGIDFRALPIRTTPAVVPVAFMLAPDQLIPVAEMETTWNEIESMVNRGVIPSSDRLTHYAATCCQNGSLSGQREKLLLCVADILRLQEDQNLATEPALRDLLVLLESM